MANGSEQSERKFSNSIDIAWQYTIAWNSKDYRQVVDLFLPEGTYLAPGSPTPIGVKAIGDMVNEFMTGFPDMVYTNIALSTIGDSISLLQYMFAGTNTGKFNGGNPTGHEVWLPGASLLTLKDGKLISVLDAYDPIAFANQLKGTYDIKQFRTMLGLIAPKK